jgi:hypothetical protein
MAVAEAEYHINLLQVLEVLEAVAEAVVQATAM